MAWFKRKADDSATPAAEFPPTIPGAAQPEDKSKENLFQLLGELPEQFSRLIALQIERAKLWLQLTLKDGGIGVAWFLVALFFIFWTIPAFGALIVAILNIWLPPWASILILMGALIVIAVVFVFLGVLRMRRIKNRENPVESVQQDVQMVKDAVDEF